MSLDVNALLSIGRVAISDMVGRVMSLDPITWALNVINYEHHEIHNGSHFNICDYALNQAVDVEHVFVVTTPAGTKKGHLTFSISASDGAEIELYEGSTDIVGGTALTPRNNNRSSSNTSIMTAVKDPTSVTLGTRVAGFLAGGTRTAGLTSREKENVLAPDTSYTVVVTSQANSNDISWCFEWYEHTDKE